MPDRTTGLAGAAEAPETDGRRLRRARNRVAAVEALIELYAEGHLDPSAAEIAERAGLSPRSLFRYFDDVDDLAHTAIEHHVRVIRPMIDHRISPDGPRAARIAELVELRIRFYEAVGSVGRVARRRAWSQPMIAQNLSLLRRILRRQTRDAFATELNPVSESERHRIIAAIELLTSFEGIDIASTDLGFSHDALRAALEADVDALLPRS